jgi:hypothetical protein
MADPDFRRRQWDERFAPHIAPVNTLVDALRADTRRGWAPYVAPLYGGIDAKLVSLSRDPGPMTREGEGSGFLCVENDDPSAEAMANYYGEVGIDAADVIAWNAYPWYINRAPNASELNAGIGPLKQLLELLPDLRVVMLHGVTAQDSWKRFHRTFPSYSIRRRLKVIPTYHTSRQAPWTPDPAERDRRKAHLKAAFADAARVIRAVDAAAV